MMRDRSSKHLISHLLAWQAWAETEGGLLRGLASYCLDRFQRFDKSRHTWVDRAILIYVGFVFFSYLPVPEKVSQVVSN